MADFKLEHRPALRENLVTEGLRLEALPEGLVLHILSCLADGELTALLQSYLPEGGALRKIAPGQWFIVDDAPMTPAALAALQDALGESAHLVDQSHGRVRFAISGKDADLVLSRLTAVDLGAPSFGIGQTQATLLGHISGHLTRTGPSAYEIIVLRSYADSLWEACSEGLKV
ncbi:sarcosine oxidase subunit gamma family protein [Martelella endophytica]|uniref:Sarcosine oxidase subunit gamma n=1 Tax=Martelella endophytica TaxID=1486262 RepID=A0A0D5LQ61_MAREN|nr:sarcosine oxidase subunit gamma family protein [Martelella endophytica]AJY46281.1 hypothetical protein TM49_12330 [Martelella endophytica]